MLKKNSSIPLYNQLIDLLINKIETKYEPNHKLMSEREICQLYDVSRTTVRLALIELENLGYIYKVHGKGSFIAKRSKDRKNLVENYSFTENMKELNKTPETIIVSFERIPVNKHLNDIMDLKQNEGAYRLERIRLANGKPMMYEISFLPISVFSDLTLHKLKSKPLYDLFNQDYKETVYYADEEFSASVMSEKEAEMLNQKNQDPCLRIQRLSYNEQEKIIEYTRSVARSDQFVYKVRLMK